MTTRHTISHADEIYAGNAYDQYYSPDGRRGIVRSHIYVHKFDSSTSPAIVGDSDGILSSYATPSLIGYTGTAAANFIGMCTGALTSNGATVISLDVPRNLRFRGSGANSASAFLKIHGRDIHGSPICETIKGPTDGGTVAGKRAFKYIDKMYTTNKFAGVVSLGTGNVLGLPFNLRDKGDVVSVTVDGKQYTSGATGYVVIQIGASYATTITSSAGQLDAKGSIEFVNPVPDGSKKLAICYQVYGQSQRTAFGPPTPSSCSNGV
jgi:hypothetical protein